MAILLVRKHSKVLSNPAIPVQNSSKHIRSYLIQICHCLHIHTEVDACLKLQQPGAINEKILEDAMVV